MEGIAVFGRIRLGWYVLLGLKNGVKSTSTQFYCGLVGVGWDPRWVLACLTIYIW